MNAFELWRSSATESEVALEVINRRERQILVHSFIYYGLNENITSDHQFDRWSSELVELIQKNPGEFEKSTYHKAFVSFDGSSGYDLPYHLPEIRATGYFLLEYSKKKANNEI